MSRKREITLLSDEEFSSDDDVLFPSRTKYVRAMSDYDTGDSFRETDWSQTSPNEASTSSGRRKNVITFTLSSSDESVIQPRTSRRGKSQYNTICTSDSSDSGLPIGFKTHKRRRLQLHLSTEEESVSDNSCNRSLKIMNDLEKPSNRQPCLNKRGRKRSHLQQTPVSTRNLGKNNNMHTEIDLHTGEESSSNKAVKNKPFSRLTMEKYKGPQGKASTRRKKHGSYHVESLEGASKKSYERSQKVNSRSVVKPLNIPRHKPSNMQNTCHFLGPRQIGRKQNPQEIRQRTTSGNNSYSNGNGNLLRNLQPCDSSSSSTDSDSSELSSTEESSSSSDDDQDTVVLSSRTAVGVGLNYELSITRRDEISSSSSSDIPSIASTDVESSELSNDSDFPARSIQHNAILESNEEDETNISANRDNGLINTNIAPEDTAVGSSKTFPDNCSDLDDDSERCPICLITFISQEVGSPSSCDHFFCLKCINEWSNTKKTCPIDRKPFNSITVRSCIRGAITREISLPSTCNDRGKSHIMTFFEDIFGTGIMYEVAARFMNQATTVEVID